MKKLLKVDELVQFCSISYQNHFIEKNMIIRREYVIVIENFDVGFSGPVGVTDQ